MGECLDHETWGTRATYFGRTEEEELVGSLDGPTRGEARARLENIAKIREVNIDIIISEETVKINSKLNKYYNVFKNFSRNSKPEVTFDATECPVCQDDEVILCSMSCGHKICNICYNLMETKPTLVDMSGRVKCPCCRKPSENLFHV
jgi:hypothetical protein